MASFTTATAKNGMATGVIEKIQNAFSLALYWTVARLVYPLLRAYQALDWKTLRRVKENKVVVSMGFWLVFVPIAAKVLHQVQDVIPVTVGSQTIMLHMTLPFSWQSLFFTSLAFSIGSVLISTTGSKLVLENEDFSDFESAGKMHDHLQEYAGRFDELEEAERNRLLHLAGVRAKTVVDSDLKAMFWKAYAIENVSRLPLRQLASLMYVLGLLLLLDILWKNVVWVVSSLKIQDYLHQLVFWPVINFILQWSGVTS